MQTGKVIYYVCLWLFIGWMVGMVAGVLLLIALLL